MSLDIKNLLRNKHIVLASASPRRKQLLSMICENYNVIPADVDETIPENMPAEEVACYLAEKKCKAIKQIENGLVIACDTIVVLGHNILGKPKDEIEAEKMLHALSGKEHSVISGVAFSYKNEIHSFYEITKVRFLKLSDKDISDYIQSGEPFDKAGGYGIQGLGNLLTEGITGDYFNVVGLPVSRLARELKKFLN